MRMIHPVMQCRSCDNDQLIEFCCLGKQPLANSLLKSAQQEEHIFPLALCYCQSCSLVQLQHTVDPATLFSHYVWVTKTSSTARQQADIFCQDAIERTELSKSDYVLELASNDGTFLRPFLNKGFQVLGIDPAANIVEQANADGIPTQCDFFNLDVAKQLVSERGRPGIVFARNVLAHVADLRGFAQGISYLLDDNNTAIVEFHYAKSILQGLQYDSIYHEHLCYLSMKTAKHLFQQFGLHVVDALEGPISGGALVLFLEKTAKPMTQSAKQIWQAEQDAQVNAFATWLNFAASVKQHTTALRQLLQSCAQQDKRVVGYGASARSSTLLNCCAATSAEVAMIADQNPLKQGLYTAGSRIPILTPEEVLATKPDVVLILAWNFLREISAVLNDNYRYEGEIIEPLPGMPVLKRLQLEEYA